MNDMHPNGVAMLHIMHRHKEILKDYDLEFRKIKHNFVSRKIREELLNEPLIEKG